MQKDIGGGVRTKEADIGYSNADMRKPVVKTHAKGTHGTLTVEVHPVVGRLDLVYH